MDRAIPFIFLPLLACVTLAATGGCDAQSEQPDGGPEPAPLRVAATVYPLADIVRQVGGKRVTVEWLRESGQGIESLEADAARRARLRSADLVVTSGAQPWTLEGSDSAYSAQRIIRLDALPSARGVPSDSYLWLNPQVAKELADTVRARLSALDPRREAFYRANADAFIADVDRAVADRAADVSPLKGAPFVSIDRGFATLAAWAGMLPMRVTDAPPRAVSDEITRRLRDALPRGMDEGSRVFFAGEDTPPAVLRELESRVAARAIMLDALGTSAPSGRTTYGQLLRYNLDQLAAAAPPATQPSSQ